MNVHQLILACTLLAGCALQGGYQADLVERGQKVTVRVTWARSTLACQPGFVACADVKGDECLVWAKEPKDFNDEAALATFGHELWHCFGARHK